MLSCFQLYSNHSLSSLGLIGCIDEGNTVGNLGHSILGDCANIAV